jgi:hypothetical protein
MAQEVVLKELAKLKTEFQAFTTYNLWAQVEVQVFHLV